MIKVGLVPSWALSSLKSGKPSHWYHRVAVAVAMDVDVATEPRGEQPSIHSCRLVHGIPRAQRQLRNRVQALYVQCGVNKKKDRRLNGVSLTMLAFNDPGFDVENGCAFMSDLVDAFSPPPLLHFDELLLAACRLACGVCALHG
jgi:hypothetical protein